MSQMSNEAADEIVRFGVPIIGGMTVMVGAGLLLEVTTSFSDDTNAQLQIKSDVATLEREIDILESANELVGNDHTIATQIEARQTQVAELEAQKSAYGNEVLNFGEAYGLPIVLGATVAVVGIKKAISKSILFPKKS